MENQHWARTTPANPICEWVILGSNQWSCPFRLVPFLGAAVQ